MQALVFSPRRNKPRNKATDRACLTCSHVEIRLQLHTLMNSSVRRWPTARYGVPLSKFEGGQKKGNISNMTREKWLQPL